VNPSSFGQPVALTATIVPEFGGQVTGSVTFVDGTATLGSASVNNNVATLTTSNLAVGTHSLVAAYGGDSNFTGNSSSSLAQVVNKAMTTTALTSSANPSISGKVVTFTAVVSPSSGMPTGTASFKDGSNILATVSLSGGMASYATAKLPTGSNSMTAVYSGDSNNSGSTSVPLNQFVLSATTSTLTSSPNPSVYGQPVIFTDTVSSSTGAPPDGEVITFAQGAVTLGTGTLSGGVATLSYSSLDAGTKAVRAIYNGDPVFAASMSKAINQVINQATTTTNLVSSLNPSTFGQAVTFAATVSPQFSGTAIGNILFQDGTTTLKTVTLSGGVASFTTSTLASGQHSIKATFNGNLDMGASSGSLNQVVH
jgi:hypothetical protein